MNEIHFLKTQENQLPEILNMERSKENAAFICANTESEHLKFINDPNFEHLILVDKNQSIIGYIILADLLNIKGAIELKRIVIKTKGKGYGKIALQMIKKRCVEKYKSKCISLDVFDFNERAKKIYLSEGFVKQGIAKNEIMKQGIPNRLVLMSCDLME